MSDYEPKPYVEALERDVGRLWGALWALEKRLEELEAVKAPVVDLGYKERLDRLREAEEKALAQELGKRAGAGVGDGGDAVTPEDEERDRSSWMLR